MILRSLKTSVIDRQAGPATNNGLLDCTNAANLSEEVAQLRTALVTNRRISMAMGMLMLDRNLDEDGAFAVLRTLSQHSNRKLRDVADDVIGHRGMPPGSERAERLLS